MHQDGSGGRRSVAVLLRSSRDSADGMRDYFVHLHRASGPSQQKPHLRKARAIRPAALAPLLATSRRDERSRSRWPPADPNEEDGAMFGATVGADRME